MSSNIKVLLVDDEAQFRATTEKILKRRGFKTVLAGNGQEALEKLSENPSVVILDIKMPGMSGLETLREIKSRDADLPVIMLTGHGSEDAAQEALQIGALDFLAKPCDVELLASKLNEAVRRRRTPGESTESRVSDVMVPLDSYTAVTAEATVGEAIHKLRESFTDREASDSLMETGHRSVLVMNGVSQVIGVLSIKDLLRAIMPAYLSAPKPSLADSIVYSPMFWVGMFKQSVKELAKHKIRDIMSPAPTTIAFDGSLMEAAYMMLQQNHRRLVVMENGKPVGVLREQDLFFEMERII
jgi:DNA-binding response OmpR family regulator